MGHLCRSIPAPMNAPFSPLPVYAEQTACALAEMESPVPGLKKRKTLDSNVEMYLDLDADIDNTMGIGQSYSSSGRISSSYDSDSYRTSSDMGS